MTQTIQFGIDRLLAEPALRRPLAGRRIALLEERLGVARGRAIELLEALDRREHGSLTTCVSELVEAGRSSCLDVVAHVRQLQQSQ